MSQERPHLKPGQVIGRVILTEEKTLRRNEQVAAWFTEITAQPGTYAVEYAEDRYGKPQAVIQYGGPITDENYATLFGGVQVGTYEKRDLGRYEAIPQAIDFADFITNAGGGEHVEYVPDPDLRDELLWAARLHYQQEVRRTFEWLGREHHNALNTYPTAPSAYIGSGAAPKAYAAALERLLRIKGQEGDARSQQRNLERWQAATTPPPSTTNTGRQASA